jgi:hypothetical protein
MQYAIERVHYPRVELRVLKIGEYFVYPDMQDKLFRKTDFQIDNNCYCPAMNMETGNCIAKFAHHLVIRVDQTETARFSRRK